MMDLLIYGKNKIIIIIGFSRMIGLAKAKSN
jgi:hypothetical protein